ncbi:hypothetical protein TNCV_295481 [Trichonephila clavipes]|nr:hypothetical protein TNCV_295481 [Trichonephila clavipes]
MSEIVCGTIVLRHVCSYRSTSHCASPQVLATRSFDLLSPRGLPGRSRPVFRAWSTFSCPLLPTISNGTRNPPEQQRTACRPACSFSSRWSGFSQRARNCRNVFWHVYLACFAYQSLYNRRTWTACDEYESLYERRVGGNPLHIYYLANGNGCVAVRLYGERNPISGLFQRRCYGKTNAGHQMSYPSISRTRHLARFEDLLPSGRFWE